LLRTLLIDKKGKLGLTINDVVISVKENRNLSFIFLSKTNRGLSQEVRNFLLAFTYGAQLVAF
jgi:hypothetical protein